MMENLQQTAARVVERRKVLDSALAQACDRAAEEIAELALKMGVPSVMIPTVQIKAIIYKAFREAKEL